MGKLRQFWYFGLFVLIACNFTRVEPLPSIPTATTVRVVQQVTPVPQDRDLQAMQATAPAAATSAARPECTGTAGLPTTAHRVVAQVDYPAHTVAAFQMTQYINHTNTTLDQLVFNVEANQWLGAFTLQSVNVAESDSTTYELTGRRLEVTLPQALEPGCTVTVNLEFSLNVPPIEPGAIQSFRGFLGYSPRQLNLGHWLPTVAVRQDGQWITRDTILIGEQVVLDQADWDVTVEVLGAEDTVTVAGPGEMSQPRSGRWQFVMADSRELMLSISDSFNVTQGQTPSGVTVEVYSFDDALVQTEDGVIDSAAHALDVGIRSLSMYEDLFGAYPYTRMLVVQGDFPDGMEFSGTMFVSGDWFRSYVGNPASYLTLITVHEVAHQWWYAKVGNDAAFDPFLDEALATYSEYIFIEEYYPDLKDWWWDFRVNRYSPQGNVDSNVYEFSTIREYINAVYLRGVLMMHDLREDLGTEAFFEWLRRYADTGAGRVVTPDTFWSLLGEEQTAATQATRDRYLGAGS